MQKLRDIIFKKEAFEALTSAEFALTLDTSVFSATSQNDESGQIRSLATIDYEGILRRLGASSRGLDQGAGSIVMTEGEIKQLRKRLDDLQEKLVQRLVMFSRAQPRKADGEATEEGANGEPKSLADRITEFGQSVQQSVARIDVVQWFKDAAAKTFEKEGEKLEPLLQAFVREDGSLDLDSVNVPPREEVVKMGGELWARLNGVPPGEEAPGRNMTALKEILKEDQAMAMLEEEVRAAQRKVMEEQRKRGAVYDALRALRGDKTAAGQSTWWGSEGEAGGKGAGEKKEVGRDGVSSIIQELREAEERCFDADQILGLWELERDMERICKYLVWELEQTDEVQEQQKLVVAEFGLLDAQVRGLRSIAMEDEEDEERLLQLSIGTEEDEEARGGEEDAGDREARRGMMQEGVGFVGMRVDPDELSIVVRDVMDLERRLGIDELLEETLPLVPKFSPAEIAKKIVDGGRFYLEGSKLLGTDVQYALKLVLKAALGVTLQPREVRTLRRTLKDVVTFVPFAIILIIPLSPVGHVLVFSFIQRFFPDFFPSPYTDRRQNLVRIYQSVELSLQNQRSTATPGRQRSSRTLERW